MNVKSESEVSQLCPTLSDLMDCSLPGSSIHGIFQARILEWGAIASSDIYIYTHTHTHTHIHTYVLCITIYEGFSIKKYEIISLYRSFSILIYKYILRVLDYRIRKIALGLSESIITVHIPEIQNLRPWFSQFPIETNTDSLLTDFVM